MPKNQQPPQPPDDAQFSGTKDGQDGQLPHQKHKFTDHEMHVLTQLRPMMGGLDPEDEEVEQHIKHYEEANAGKMRSAQTGGSPGLGPTEAEQALAKQQTVLQQQVASSGAATAQQAQAGEPSQPTPPPAPTGSAGVTIPYPAQKGAVGGAGQAPQGAGGSPQGEPPEAPAAPGGEEQEQS
jgi:hypothetical protein